MSKPKFIEQDCEYDEYCQEYLIDWGDGSDPEVVYSDMWQQDCPEDLTWHRLISDVFSAGIRYGKEGGE